MNTRHLRMSLVLAAMLGIAACNQQPAQTGAAAPGGATDEAASTAVAALPEAGQAFRDCADCPEMVVVPPGSYEMGTPEGWVDIAGKKYGQADENPLHMVTIGYKFALSKTEVIRAEYQKFADETKRLSSETCLTDGKLDKDNLAEEELGKGLNWKNPGYEQGDNHPVVCVNWLDAHDYVAWLSAKTGKNYRLASEAEWEYAARAGQKTLWYWGDNPDDACKYGNVADLTSQKGIPGYVSIPNCDDTYAKTAPVGSFMPNQFGLYDMSGNVWEWLEDCSTDNYKDTPTDGSAYHGGDCDYRIYRGGVFSCTLTCNTKTIPERQVNNVQPGAVIRPGNRDRKVWSYRSNHNGIRIARSD